VCASSIKSLPPQSILIADSYIRSPETYSLSLSSPTIKMNAIFSRGTTMSKLPKRKGVLERLREKRRAAKKPVQDQTTSGEETRIYSELDADQASLDGEASSAEPEIDLCDFQPIPTAPLLPDNSNFVEVWRPVLTLEYVYWPVYIDFSALPQSPSEARIVKTDELNESVLYVQNYVGDELVPFNIVYTDSRIMKSGTMIKRCKPHGYFDQVLYDPNTAGLSFNQASRVMDRDIGDYTFLNKEGLAELIGFIQTQGNEVPVDQPYHEFVRSAAAEGKLYEVLYYWGRSYRTPRPGDDWTTVHLEKLHALWNLDFSGSRQRAAAGIQWFIENHGETPERVKTLRSWAR